MFSTLGQARSPRRNRTIPHLECLETRFCPSGPELGGGGGFGGPMLRPTIAIDVTEAANHCALVTGQVSDPQASGGTVIITGVVTTTIPIESASGGAFSYTGLATSLGQVHAEFVDFWGMHSNVATADLTSAIPVITDFTARDLGSNEFLFQGFVNDEYAAGLTVHLTGLSFGTGGVDVTVSVTGWFSIIQAIGNASGSVKAETADVWGQAADPAFVFVP